MNEKPIIFSTLEVRAILEGRKNQTRRVMKPQPTLDANGWMAWKTVRWLPELSSLIIGKQHTGYHHLPFKPGDVLWVRETWFYALGTMEYLYRADSDTPLRDRVAGGVNKQKWRSPIHMPHAAARIFLRVKDVRVEKLNEISQEDAKAEGVYEIRPNWWFFCDPATISAPNCTLAATPKQAFMWLWNFLYRKNIEISWGNSFVWVYTFERIDAA